MENKDSELTKAIFGFIVIFIMFLVASHLDYLSNLN